MCAPCGLSTSARGSCACLPALERGLCGRITLPHLAAAAGGSECGLVFVDHVPGCLCGSSSCSRHARKVPLNRRVKRESERRRGERRAQSGERACPPPRASQCVKLVTRRVPARILSPSTRSNTHKSWPSSGETSGERDGPLSRLACALAAMHRALRCAALSSRFRAPRKRQQGARILTSRAVIQQHRAQHRRRTHAPPSATCPSLPASPSLPLVACSGKRRRVSLDLSDRPMAWSDWCYNRQEGVNGGWATLRRGGGRGVGEL